MALHSTIINPGDWARIDSKETPSAYVFVADLPGLKKEQVKVETVDNRVLQISGERKDDDDDDGGGSGGENMNRLWHCKERSSGPFLRKFRLPEDANVELVKAKFEHGVLTVTVPKVEQTKAKAIEISVSGGEGGKKLPAAGRKKKMLCCGLGV